MIKGIFQPFKRDELLLGKDITPEVFSKYQNWVNAPKAQEELKGIAASLAPMYEWFEQKLDETANATHTHNVMKNTGVKRLASAVGKIIDKHAIEHKDHYTFSDMTDWIRGTLIAKDETLARHALSYIEKNWKIADKPIDYFKHPNKGYRGLHVIVDLPNGLRGEIQIHTPESLSYKLETMKEYEKYGYKKFSQMPDNIKDKLEQESKKYFHETPAGKPV